MELIAAAILGIVQGLTEFLPISSSAHLILIPWLLGWDPEGLVFDVSLHMGTAIAILAYFWRDWVRLATEALRGIVEGKPFDTPQRKLAWLLIVGTVPAGLIGFLFEKQIEESLRSPLIIVATLTSLAGVLYFAERRSRRTRSLVDYSWGDAVWIGLSQALALIPGVSRSGITITAAMLRDSDRVAAARFSFLLATPITVGAGIFKGWELIQALQNASTAIPAGADHMSWTVLGVGASCAAITGFLCIRYFLHYLQTRTFLPFVIYRIALAAVVLLLYLA
jgi:undecaprenyl-diphosphatase